MQDGHFAAEGDQAVAGLTEPQFGVLPSKCLLMTESGVLISIGGGLVGIQLRDAYHPASQIGQIQVNFINTNRIPTDPNDPGTKLFDAIGDARVAGGVNNPLSIPTAQAGLFQNSQLVPPEPQGDVVQAGNGTLVSNNDPDLDIINWSIRVVR